MPGAFDMNDAILRDFCSKYPLRHFKKNRPIFYQGEIPQSVFYIKGGVAKLYNITNGGDEKIVGYESADGLMPLEWMFNRSPVALFYYDTFTDAEMYSVPKNELLEFIKNTHQLALTLLDRYVGSYIGKIVHLHALEQSKARDKMLYIWQYLVLRFGKPISKTHYKVDLRLTHQEIANLIGVTRETVSMEISKLTKTGILNSKDSHYIVNVDRAMRELGENDFNKLVL
jgi:CRP/FNR family cyclic AMP-dependent transcriptional regulator